MLCWTSAQVQCNEEGETSLWLAGRWKWGRSPLWTLTKENQGRNSIAMPCLKNKVLFCGEGQLQHFSLGQSKMKTSVTPKPLHAGCGTPMCPSRKRAAAQPRHCSPPSSASPLQISSPDAADNRDAKSGVYCPLTPVPALHLVTKLTS